MDTIMIIIMTLFFFSELADLANNYKGFLSPDKDCSYDELIEIDLSKVIFKK